MVCVCVHTKTQKQKAITEQQVAVAASGVQILNCIFVLALAIECVSRQAGNSEDYYHRECCRQGQPLIFVWLFLLSFSPPLLATWPFSVVTTTVVASLSFSPSLALHSARFGRLNCWAPNLSKQMTDNSCGFYRLGQRPMTQIALWPDWTRDTVRGELGFSSVAATRAWLRSWRLPRWPSCC